MRQPDESPDAVESVQETTKRGLFRRSRAATFGGVITFLFVATGAVGLVMIAHPGLNYLYLDGDLSTTRQPPLSGHGLLGTDALGRDLLARVVAGVGVSLAIASTVAALSILIGGLIGMLAGYHGGRLDTLLSGLIDVTWGFPMILVIIILAGVLSPGFTTVVLGIVAINWAGFARVVRGDTLKLRELDFVRASRAIGAPHRQVIRRHIAPNLVAPSLVFASYYVAITIVAEAAVSYLGVGAQPPTPSLGQIIAEGQPYLNSDPWMVATPGLVLVVIVIGLNTLGDGARDLIDPRLRTSA